LIKAGIKEVVAGMADPNPLVAGEGFTKLRRAGIKVRVGVHEKECRALLEAFAKFITRRLPFVTLKLAATLDGKIASSSGDSQWVSGAKARALVHRWRNEYDAVLIGGATARADNPQLTCRTESGRNPYRIVLDSRLRLALTSRLLRQKDPAKTIIATTRKAPPAKVRAIESLGAIVWRLPARGNHVAWQPLLIKLAAMGVVSVLVEGGAAVAASALKEKIIDKVEFFYAPKIIGADGRAMIDGLGLRKMAHAVSLRELDVRRVGDDILLSGYL
jgi:diaminohydroxyphosphoribosylaminopyrimidine deaminase/5-amino-6-(5-phosphoribosylamino)uracil reductase